MGDGVVAGGSARDRLVLPLDVGDLVAAEAMARLVRPWFGVVKVGLELFCESGPDAWARFHDLGYRVFADLKLHDIPTTVRRAARVLGRGGIDMATFHAAGGIEMMRAANDGLLEGAEEAGRPAPVGLAVTVLTSDRDASAFPDRLEAAVEAGCGGVVCAAAEVRASAAAGMATMVPGIRPTGTAPDDQARIATPSDAIADGATWLVVGRPVTAAADPAAAAAAIHGEVEAALAGSRERTGGGALDGRA